MCADKCEAKWRNEQRIFGFYFQYKKTRQQQQSHQPNRPKYREQIAMKCDHLMNVRLSCRFYIFFRCFCSAPKFIQSTLFFRIDVNRSRMNAAHIFHIRRHSINLFVDYCGTFGIFNGLSLSMLTLFPQSDFLVTIAMLDIVAFDVLFE